MIYGRIKLDTKHNEKKGKKMKIRRESLQANTEMVTLKDAGP